MTFSAFNESISACKGAICSLILFCIAVAYCCVSANTPSGVSSDVYSTVVVVVSTGVSVSVVSTVVSTVVVVTVVSSRTQNLP